MLGIAELPLAWENDVSGWSRGHVVNGSMGQPIGLARALGPIHCVVCAFVHGLHPGIPRLQQCNAQARTDLKRPATVFDRQADLPDQLLGNATRLGDRLVRVGVQMANDDREFVAAQSTNHILGTKAGTKPGPHRSQQRVAGAVAVLVVDRLEP